MKRLSEGCMNEPGLQTNCDERKRERRVNLNYESETSKDTRKFLKKLNSQRDTRVSTRIVLDGGYKVFSPGAGNSISRLTFRRHFTRKHSRAKTENLDFLRFLPSPP